MALPCFSYTKCVKNQIFYKNWFFYSLNRTFNKFSTVIFPFLKEGRVTGLNSIRKTKDNLIIVYRIIRLLFLSALLSIGVSHAFGVNLYWVGGSGEWNDTKHWSNNSGGKSANAIPSVVDNVIFDAQSFTAPNQTVKIIADANCKDLTWGKVQPGTIFSAPKNVKISIGGSLTFASNVVNNLDGTIEFTSSQPCSITSAGKSFKGEIKFNGSGSWTLTDGINAAKISLEKGTFITNGKNLVCGSFIGSGSNQRSLSLGSSKVKVSGTWDFSDTKNLDFNAGTSQITFKKNTSTDLKLGNDLAYSKITIDHGQQLLSHVATVTVTPVTCNGRCDGTATVSVSGGVGPYSYQWVTSTQTTATITGLCVDNYYCIVTDDGNGGEIAVSNSANVTGPGLLTIVGFNNVNVSCSGVCDGKSTPVIAPGTPPYSYAWSPGGQTTSQATGLCATTYTLVVTDANLCTTSRATAITQPNPLIANGSSTNISCNGLCDGIASVAPSGGSTPYTYSWSTTATTTGISSLCVGVYTATVTDKNNCVTTYTTSITQPAVLAVTTSSMNVTCGGLCNATAGVTPSGGTSPYTYAWSPGGQATSSVTGLCPNTYTVLVNDTRGCTLTQTILITEPSALTSVPTATNVTCFGLCTGKANANAAGGTSPYTYAWSTGATTAIATGLCATSFTVTVTDSKLCVATGTITITEPPILAAGLTNTNITCNGSCDGTATSTPTGGTPAYTYLWSSLSATTASITGKCVGVYNATVTDGNGCVATGSVSITQPVALSAGTAKTDLFCNGSCIGTASVTPAGGTAPYTYAWVPGGATSQMVTGLCAGTYTCTIRDANACVLTRTVTITQPVALTVGITSTSLTCNGVCSGAAAASPAGGTAPYTYLWNNASTKATITGLCAGSFSVTVRDANGCTGTQTVTIVQPTALTGTPSQTNTTCNNVCDGTASVLAGGGTMPYTYRWNPGAQTTSSVTGLCDGTYTFSLTDANSCLVTNSVTITEPVVLSANPSATNVSCSGLCDGVVTSNPSGGTSPYSYVWSTGGSTTQSVSGLCAGAYNVVVTDANLCQSNQPVTITQPALLNAVLGAIVNTCSSCAGSANVSPTGGTAPYTYLWSDGQTTATASNLCIGTYSVLVTDSRGCTATNTANIAQTVNIAITFSSPNVSCFGSCDGIAVANPSGGNNPYTYNWSPGLETTQTITGLCAGAYSVTVLDSLGCFNTGTITLTEPAALTLTLTASNASCNGVCDGSVTATPAGGTMPYTYAWLPGNQTTSSLTGLCAGTYTVTLRDANSCVTTETVTITEAPIIAANPSVSNATCLTNDGGITLAPTGGVGGFSFVWAPGGEITQNITNLFAGTYTVTITDAAGCTSATTANVSNPSGPTVSSTQVNVNCFGACNGVGTVSVTAGSSPYAYLWNPAGETTTAVSSLCAGTYNVSITDNFGCVTLVAINITEPAIISTTNTVANVSCGGACDGSVSVSVAGGNAPYTYAWSPGGQTTSSRTGLCAQTYTIDITDANSCLTTQTVTVTEPAVLTMTITGNDVSCNGFNNGGAVANVSGGSTPYTYAWLPGGEIISTVTNLSPGTYTLNVQDANTCTITGTLTIAEPAILTSTVTGTNISCNSLCDGTTMVSASGGTSPYSYSWNPIGQTTASMSSLCAATYSAVVTDMNGCIVTNTISITEPVAFSFGFTTTSVTCNGTCNGTIGTNLTGGTGPYTYAWSPGGETTTGISSLCAATYTLLVTDANLCTGNQSATIAEPNVLQAAASSSSTSCIGACNGVASASPIGGNGPYTYLWSPGNATTSSISGLCAGTYTVLVTDANACTDEKAITVSDPTPITILSAVAGANCGICNGSIDVTPSGGTGSTYTFAWSPVSSTLSNLTGLCAGLYTVTVQDSLSCSAQFLIPLSNTGGPTGETITNTDVTCNGACNGTSLVVPIGGTMPYTYSWTPGGQTTNSLTGMCAGVYILEVKDANSCIRFVQDTINEPPAIISNSVLTNATCNGICDGALSVAPTGGSGPFTYSWMPGGETTTSITSICAGAYTITITDSLGCSLVENPTVGQNTIVSVTLTASTNVSCNGGCNGKAAVIVSGGLGPYTYLWNDPMLQSDSIATGLCAGTYTISVNDVNGCVGTQTVTISEPAVIALNPAVIDATCGLCNGQVTLTPTGGTTPFTYGWSDGQTTSVATGLCASIYNVLVTDSNGCTSSLIQVINNAGGPTGESIITTSVDCNGNCNGTASITAIGGTSPYSYLWLATGQTANSLTGLCGGTYFVQMSDSNGCIRTASVVIAEPLPFSTGQVVVDATCGLCDGSITLSPSGGSSPYTFVWSPGGETTSAITGLCPGMYTVSVSDNSSCSQQFQIPISNPTGPTVGIVTTDVICNGSCDGTATANVSGGLGPYVYSWNTGQVTPAINGLCAGSYFVKVTDAALCVTIATYTISEPSAITFNPPIVVSPVCNTGCNGTATVLALGGSFPYNYSWNNGQTTTLATGLCPSVYSVIVTDQVGCTNSLTLAISNIGGPTGETIITTSVSCFGVCDGTASITPIGGSTPYSYLWLFGGQTTNALSSLCGGTYFIQIQDSNSCVRTTSLTIDEPAQFIINQNVVGATCGLCDGSITLNPTGGTLPYTFAWSGGETTSSVTGLCVGMYTVTINDASGCGGQTFNIPISNPTGPAITFTVTDAKCNGSCDGVVLTTATGNSPFSYSWNLGQTTSDVSSLCAGNYYVEVTDFNLCVTIGTVSIAEPSQLVYNLPVTTLPLCNGDCNGAIITIPFGGTSPYTFSWNTGATTSSASNLCAGTYTITLSDNNGCTAIQNAVLTQPSPLAISNSVIDASCSNSTDGSINVTVAGGTAPYTYQWVAGSVATSEDLVNIGPGTYSLLVTDANGCTGTDSIVVGSTLIVDAIAGTDTTFCEGDSAIIKGTGSIGTSFKWYRLPAIVELDTHLVVTVKPFVGTNTYMLVAYNGMCTDTDYVVVTSLSLPSADAGNDAIIFTNTSATLGGSPTGPAGSTIHWTPPAGLTDTAAANPVANPTVTTTYTVTVTNSNGCSSTDTVRVTVLPKIVFPNGISPNGDGKNDVWIIDNIYKFPEALVEVYNRWGELLFRSVGYTTQFDGTYDGKPLPVGTYYYIINLNSPEFPDAYTGPLTIMR